jgi:hypothetical protein
VKFICLSVQAFNISFSFPSRLLRVLIEEIGGDKTLHQCQ